MSPREEKPKLKIAGKIRLRATQEVEAEGEGCGAAREHLLASIPEGFELLLVHRDS